MNPHLASDLATRHAIDLQRTAGQRPRRSAPPAPRALSRGHRPSLLRRQVGFRLVEAGLHLLSGPADT